MFSIDVLVEVLSCGMTYPFGACLLKALIEYTGVVLHRLFELWNFGPIVSKIVLVTFFASKVLLFAFAGSSIFLIKSWHLFQLY